MTSIKSYFSCYRFIPNILRWHCTPDQDRYITWYQQIWYTIKAIICILLSRPDVKGENIYEDCVFVAVTDGGSYFSSYDSLTIHWGEWLVVDFGIFTGWRWSLYQDSN